MPTEILIVEDDFIVARYLKEILNEEGYSRVTHVSNATKAYEILDSRPIGLALLDVSLSESQDGVEIARKLLIKDRVPYIFITSYSDRITLNRLKEVRPHGIIIKPFKNNDIRASVSIVLNNYLYKNIDVVRHLPIVTDEAPLRIKEVVRYIDEHIFEKIEIDTLVPITRWKKHHFIRVFSQYMGFTPYKYILNKKIEKSKVLLEATDLAVADIAIDLGFYNSSNFCAIFKKYSNITPEAYRKQFLIRRKL